MFHSIKKLSFSCTNNLIFESLKWCDILFIVGSLLNMQSNKLKVLSKHLLLVYIHLTAVRARPIIKQMLPKSKKAIIATNMANNIQSRLWKLFGIVSSIRMLNLCGDVCGCVCSCSSSGAVPSGGAGVPGIYHTVVAVGAFGAMAA